VLLLDQALPGCLSATQGDTGRGAQEGHKHEDREQGGTDGGTGQGSAPAGPALLSATQGHRQAGTGGGTGRGGTGWGAQGGGQKHGDRGKGAQAAGQRKGGRDRGHRQEARGVTDPTQGT